MAAHSGTSRIRDSSSPRRRTTSASRRTSPVTAGRSRPPLGRYPRFFGHHYNTGPLGAGAPGRFWSSNAPDHSLLFLVDIIISRWTPKLALERFNDGYVHYHELVREGDGCVHPRLVAWFKHTAIESFSFDGGPPPVLPDGTFFRPRNVPFKVRPGIAHGFMVNYDVPYKPQQQRIGREAFPVEVCKLSRQ